MSVKIAIMFTITIMSMITIVICIVVIIIVTYFSFLSCTCIKTPSPNTYLLWNVSSTDALASRTSPIPRHTWRDSRMSFRVVPLQDGCWSQWQLYFRVSSSWVGRYANHTSRSYSTFTMICKHNGVNLHIELHGTWLLTLPPAYVYLSHQIDQ